MIKSKIKQLMRTLGLEIRRYNPIVSEQARLIELFKTHDIDLVLDIGANEGQYTQLIRELGYQGQVISFEPLSSAYQKLQKRSYKDTKWMLAPRAALGDINGEITVNIAGNSKSSSVLPMLKTHEQAAPKSVYIGSERVPVYRLDAVPLSITLEHFQSIFAKVDVQGFEKQVIKGGKSLLPKIKGMQIELSIVHLYDNQPLYQDVIQWLQNLGYELYGFFPTFIDPTTFQLLQFDGIFFKP
ncbi:MAG: FkbM family methyltransferase [Microcystaceae cyanobacterium]